MLLIICSRNHVAVKFEDMLYTNLTHSVVNIKHLDNSNTYETAHSIQQKISYPLLTKVSKEQTYAYEGSSLTWP